MEAFKINLPHSSSEGLGLIVGDRLSDEAVLEIVDWSYEGREVFAERHLTDYSSQEREVILRAYYSDVYMRSKLQDTILLRYRKLTDT